jgi:hypothetical protein
VPENWDNDAHYQAVNSVQCGIANLLKMALVRCMNACLTR